METAKTLDQLLDLLNADEPRVTKAKALLKELLVKGPCRSEVDTVRTLLSATVEQLIKPLCGDNRGRQVQVDRLLRAIKESELPTSAALGEPLTDVAQWVKALSSPDTSAPRDQLPPNFAERILAALHLMGQGEAWLVEAVEQMELHRQEERLTWEELHTLLGRIVTQGEIARTSWRHERESVRKTLAEVASRFAATLQEIGEVDAGMTGMVDRLASSDSLDDLNQLKELLIREAGTLQKHASSLGERVRESQTLVDRSRTRLQQMEEALHKARDQHLQDPFTGLANKFSFVAHLDRQLERCVQLEEPFSVGYFQLDNLRPLVLHLGREVGRRLVVALAQRVRKELDDKIFLARLAEDRFGMLFPGMATAEARKPVERLADLLEHTRFRLGEESIQVRASFVLVGHGAGVSARKLLKSANEALSLAARQQGNRRILVIQPDQPSPDQGADDDPEE